MATLHLPIVAMFQTSRLAKQFQVPWDPRLAPTARDIPRPPANPVGLALALVGLMAVVVAIHRLGLFRVPNWELPPALRRGLRRSGRDRASAAGPDEGAGHIDVLSRRD